MCGRYYIDDAAVKAIVTLVRSIDRDLKFGKKRDIYPSNESLALYEGMGQVEAGWMKWGYPGFQKDSLLINARAESALEKRTFAEDIQTRRCVLPAGGFYEWNSRKEKCSFWRADASVLYMAGCFHIWENKKCFVILPPEANASVAGVHSRMPLVLEPDEVKTWILDGNSVSELLKKKPTLLERSQEYEQLSLF